MVKITPHSEPWFPDGRLSGLLVGRTFRGQEMYRRYAVPDQPNTFGQVGQTLLLRFLTQTWLDISNDDRETWDWTPGPGNPKPPIHFRGYNMAAPFPFILALESRFPPQNPKRQPSDPDFWWTSELEGVTTFEAQYTVEDPNVWAILVCRDNTNPPQKPMPSIWTIESFLQHQAFGWFRGLARSYDPAYTYFGFALSFDGVHTDSFQYPAA